MEKSLIDQGDAAQDTTTWRPASPPNARKNKPHRHHHGPSNSSSRAYFLLAGLVFTASASIYVSSVYSSDSSSSSSSSAAGTQQQSLWQQYADYQFAPSRLEEEPSVGEDGDGDGGDGEELPPVGSDPTDGPKSSVSTTAKEEEAQKDGNNNNNDDDPVKIEKPLNVVVLYADDWRHDDLGTASNGVVHTPFLDWLANKKGMRFTHNCVTTSVCWVSRATLHTGQYYSRHKATRPRDNGWYEGWKHTFPAVLRDLGYYVAHIGKWHSADFKKIKDTYHYEQMYYGRHWFPGNPRPIHITERNERDALDMLQNRPKDKPFSLTVAFFAPHSWDGHPDQYLPQNWTQPLYKGLTFNKTQADMEASFQKLPISITNLNEGRRRFKGRFDDPTKANTMIANYYRLISGVDAACEKVWKELEAQGILDETMVIFSTDNGYYHGEHGLAGKWYPHEESIRVPLIIHDPRMPPNKRGSTDDSFTLNIDLAPTILGAVNATRPDTYQGRDISDLYLRQGGGSNGDKAPLSPPWREEFFYEHPIHINEKTIPASSALVRKDIKYVVWPNFEVAQIFNLTIDPMEEEDQIKNLAYSDIIKEMKARHDSLREEVGQEHTTF